MVAHYELQPTSIRPHPDPGGLRIIILRSLLGRVVPLESVADEHSRVTPDRRDHSLSVPIVNEAGTRRPTYPGLVVLGIVSQVVSLPADIPLRHVAIGILCIGIAIRKCCNREEIGVIYISLSFAIPLFILYGSFKASQLNFSF